MLSEKVAGPVGLNKKPPFFLYFNPELLRPQSLRMAGAFEDRARREQ